MTETEDVSHAVLDASIAVRWLVPEGGSDAAAALIERPISWIAPHLLVTEVAAALRRKTDAGELRAELALQANRDADPRVRLLAIRRR